MMENFEFTENHFQSLKCSYCTNSNSLIGLCKNFHYVCCDCQRTFLTCPICAGPYLPQDDFVLETVLGPVNEAKQIALTDLEALGNPLTRTVKGRSKRSPVEKCKEHFFVAVWEGLTAFIFSGLTKKRTKGISATESVSKILSKVTRKMGKSIYDWILIKNPDRKTLKVSLSILALLIGTQLVLQAILKRSESTPTIINIAGEQLKVKL